MIWTILAAVLIAAVYVALSVNEWKRGQDRPEENIRYKYPKK